MIDKYPSEKALQNFFFLDKPRYSEFKKSGFQKETLTLMSPTETLFSSLAK